MRKNRYHVTFEETTFFGLLKILKADELKNWSFYLSFLFTFCIFVLIVLNNNFIIITNLLAEKLAVALLGASASILAIDLAGLAITVAIFRPPLLPRMLETKLLHRLLFPFWFSAAWWSISIFLCIILILLEVLGKKILISSLLLVEVFVFLFSTFYTVSLTGVIVRLALQTAQVYERENSDSSD